MTNIIAYTYESDTHCPECTAEKFPPADISTLLDSDGNPRHPVFSTDEIPAEGLHCGDCHCCIAEGEPQATERRKITLYERGFNDGKQIGMSAVKAAIKLLSEHVPMQPPEIVIELRHGRLWKVSGLLPGQDYRLIEREHLMQRD